MASPGSFIRSAAQATSSAYRRLPIRWRLAGGSALLTLVILLGFATIVGVLTTRRIQSDFNRQVADAANDLKDKVRPRIVFQDATVTRYDFSRLAKGSSDLDTYAASQKSAVIRLVTSDGDGAQGDRRRALPAASARADPGLQRLSDRVAGDRAARRRLLRPVRAQAVRRRGDGEPRARVPRPRRDRRRRAGAARRTGDRDARDGADHAADRRGERDRAHARPVAADPPPRVAATRSRSWR